MALAALIVGSGCSSVYVPAAIGEKPHALDPAAWEGLWWVEGDAAMARVVDAAGGELRLSGMNSRDGKVVLTSATLFIRESGDGLFASIQMEETPKGQFVWAWLKRDGDRIVGWAPDVDRFRQLVQAGKLKGVVSASNDVYLEALTPAAAADLTTEKYGMLFEWQKPFMLRRGKP